jgi:hypothetical protein
LASDRIAALAASPTFLQQLKEIRKYADDESVILIAIETARGLEH